jgi:hypothetical protein
MAARGNTKVEKTRREAETVEKTGQRSTKKQKRKIKEQTKRETKKEKRRGGGWKPHISFNFLPKCTHCGGRCVPHGF